MDNDISDTLASKVLCVRLMYGTTTPTFRCWCGCRGCLLRGDFEESH